MKGAARAKSKQSKKKHTVKLRFKQRMSAAKANKAKRFVESITGTSATIDQPEREKGTQISLLLPSSKAQELFYATPKLKLSYPSFERAKEIEENSCISKTEVKLFFQGNLSTWEGKIAQLVKCVAQISGTDIRNIKVIEIREGSIIITLRLPEVAAKIIISSKDKFAEKFPSLSIIQIIERIADSPVDSRIVEAAVPGCKSQGECKGAIG